MSGIYNNKGIRYIPKRHIVQKIHSAMTRSGERVTFVFAPYDYKDSKYYKTEPEKSVRLLFEKYKIIE